MCFPVLLFLGCHCSFPPFSVSPSFLPAFVGFGRHRSFLSFGNPKGSEFLSWLCYGHYVYSTALAPFRDGLGMTWQGMVVPQVAACSAWLHGTRAGCTAAWVDRQTHWYMAAMLRLIPVCSLAITSNGLYPFQNSQQTDGYRSRYHTGPAPGPALAGFSPARYHALASDDFWFPWGQRCFQSVPESNGIWEMPGRIFPSCRSLA